MPKVETDEAQPLVEPLAEPLTRRQAQMLALLAAGYSRSEIAAHLTLALSSVKFHLHHLYGKLGVNSKRQALSRAKALGLLAPSPPGDHSPAPRHNLPMQVTRFFGRESEMAQLRERLDENRLVTLTGPGGVGKTRLALRSAEELLPGITDGVWLVELAPLSDPGLVAQQTASSLGLRDDAGRPSLENLTAYLRDRQVLLVLDNCEHLLAACGRLADSLLRACPRVRILATSREPLGIAGEAVFSVSALAYPDPDHLPPIDQMTGYAAISLLLDRARLALPDYVVAAHNAAALARICQRLDGLPLALEMAAARLNILDAEQLAARLDDAFRLLTGGSRSALPRQQTLRATLDWSYDLLSAPERLLLQRLSVFGGGFTLAAAEAVCAGDGLPAHQVLDLLASLAAKSMVAADRLAGVGLRYRLPETVRQYAQEKLSAAGQTAQLRARHRDYFLAFAEMADMQLESPERLSWIRKVEADFDNLRLALEWSFSDLALPDAGPRLLIALLRLPWASYQEQLDWLQRGVALCESRADIAPRLHVKLLEVTSNYLALNDPPACLAWSERAVEISRRLGPEEKETLMWCLLNWAGNLAVMGDAEDAARAAALAEAETILETLGPEHYQPDEALRVRGFFASAKAFYANQQGRYQEAKLLAAEGIRLYQQGGPEAFTYSARMSLATACLELGEYDQARGHFLAAMHLGGDAANQTDAHVVRWLAAVDIRQGNLDRALDYCQASLREAAKIPDRNMIASCLGLFATIFAKQKHPVRAARLSGASHALYARQKRNPWEDSSLDTLLPGWREGQDYAVISAAFEEGQAMSAEQALAFALDDTQAPKVLKR